MSLEWRPPSSRCQSKPALSFRPQDYLSDRDFERLLGTSRFEFQQLPKWRQNDIKKKAGLF